MDNLRCHSNNHSIQNTSPTVENVALNDRVNKLADKSTESTYEEVYKNFVSFIFQQIELARKAKVDEEKEPITW